MPQLIEEHEIRLEWNDILSRAARAKPATTAVRSAGAHLSGVIRYCLVALGKLSKDDLDKEEMPVRMAVGMAWEEWVIGLWPDIIWQPGEQEKDGVSGTPDGLSICGVDMPQIEEFKATWKSRRGHSDVTQELLWMWQVAGYCCMLQVRRARMHILWVCGDYKDGPPTPAYVTYLVEFTREELDKFWQNVILRNKDKAEKEPGSASIGGV